MTGTALTGTALTAGYQPDRIRALAARTASSIDQLAAIRSDDPAAADAMRALRLLRRNLEDHWMPLLRRIEDSDAMTRRHDVEASRWQARTEAYLRPSTERIAPMDDDRLFEEFSILSFELAQGGHDATLWRDFLAASQVLAARAGAPDADDGFADRVVEAAGRSPLVGQAIEAAHFDDELVARMAAAMLAHEAWSDSWTWNIRGRSVEPALRRLTERPDLALALLQRSDALHSLAARPGIDPGVVSEFVYAALATTVHDDVARLGDGYRVIAELTVIANGPAEDGLEPGMARGLALALPTYLGTLAPHLGVRGTDRVLIVDHEGRYGLGDGVDLGSHDELIDLVGAVLHDGSAQVMVGTTIGLRVTDAFTSGTGDDRSDTIQFVELVRLAVENEHAEHVIRAASAETRRRLIGEAAEATLGAVLTATRASLVKKLVLQGASAAAVDRFAHVEPERLPDSDPVLGDTGLFVSDSITATVLRHVLVDVDARRDAGLDDVAAADWARLGELLDEFDAAGNDHDARRWKAEAITSFVRSVPPLAAHLAAARAVPGLHDLAIGRPGPVDT